jgi:hypothetical protein
VENLILTGGFAGGGGWLGGGGAFLTFADCTVRNCSVQGNEALFGGGIYAEGGSPLLEFLDVSGNSAQVTGGGLGFYASEATVRHSRVSGNSSGDDGGGVYMTLGDLVLENVLVSSNYSGDDGGGVMHLQGGRCFLNFTTIDSNTCLDDGAGVLASRIDSLVVFSSIITSNSGNGGVGVKTTYEAWLVVSSCVWGNGSVNYLNMPDQTGTMGNISEDPLYADPMLRLSQTASGQAFQSPAVDAGSGSAWGSPVAGMSTRTDSVPDEGVADMGFHHGVPDSSSGPGGSGGLEILACPNPARESVFLRLSVPGPAVVDLTVWDMYGRRIDSMTSLAVTGSALIPWEPDPGLPSGILLFRITSGSSCASAALVWIP